MNNHKDRHLNEEELLLFVVEETQPPMPLQEHLAACPRCRANKEELERDLARLGQMAERYAPSPKRRISLPLEETRRSLGWSWSWRAFAGAAAAAALVLILVWWSPMTRNMPGGNGDMLAQEMEEAEQFMAEVGTLVENALPPVYMDILAESGAGFDDEFIEFVVPSVEDETLSRDSGRRGALLC